MQKLRHVVITPVQIPPDFHEDMPPLENVQTFSFLVLCFEDAETFLRTIPKVRKLKCVFHLSGAPRGVNQAVKLDFLCQLASLFMRYSDFTRLKLHSCSFSFPSTLRKLTLMDFKQPWSKVSAIAELPNLEFLKLSNAFCGKFWSVGDEEFSKLKFLGLKMLDIEELIASDESFPSLECLEVDYCPKFLEIPSRFGSIYTLKMIRVVKCRSTVNTSVKKIQKEQFNSGNEQLEVFRSRAIDETSRDSDLDSSDDLDELENENMEVSMSGASGDRLSHS